jgi:hypothetical protein
MALDRIRTHLADPASGITNSMLDH